MTKKRYTGFLAYKLKSRPELFQVRENTNLEIKPDGGPFSVYKLIKTGWNTTDALMRVARHHRIPLHSLKYGGKKDRHAVTEQYITFNGKKNLSMKTDAWSFERAGFSRQPMSPSQIRSNSFEIILSGMQQKELPIFEANLNYIREYGFPNYFDSQRFGTYHSVNGIALMHVYRGKPFEALKEILFFSYKNSSKEAIHRKQKMKRLWPDYSACLKIAESGFEIMALKELAAEKENVNALNILNRMPHEELQMQISAVQSLIFNRALTIETECSCRKYARIKTKTGDLCFPLSAWNGPDTIRLPGHSADELSESVRNAMKEFGIKQEALSVPEFSHASMKSFTRPVQVVPANIQTKKTEKESGKKDRIDLKLSFDLPSGSYATMMIKRAMLRVSAGKPG